MRQKTTAFLPYGLVVAVARDPMMPLSLRILRYEYRNVQVKFQSGKSFLDAGMILMKAD
jgi:hypothetical protein